MNAALPTVSYTLSPAAVCGLLNPGSPYLLDDSLKRLASAHDTPAHVRDWLLKLASAEPQHTDD